MFSWIIEWQAKILNITAWLITIENTFSEELEIWQSIAHDWACMTITDFDKEKYIFFSMEESFLKTNFWEKKAWDIFNVERSLTFWWKVEVEISRIHEVWPWVPYYFACGFVSNAVRVVKWKTPSSENRTLTISVLRGYDFTVWSSWRERFTEKCPH